MDWQLMIDNLPLLLEGLKRTVAISVVGVVLAAALAAILVALQRSGKRWLIVPVRVYTEIVLGMPNLVLLYVVFYVLPGVGLLIEPLAAGLITLILYYSPYFAEVIRGALAAIPVGQMEAGRSVGMSRPAVMWRIVLPQAFGLMLPPMTNLIIGLIKDSSILSVISVVELAFQTKQVVARTYAPFEVYLLVAVIYWVLISIVAIGLRRAERWATFYRRA